MIKTFMPQSPIVTPSRASLGEGAAPGNATAPRRLPYRDLRRRPPRLSRGGRRQAIRRKGQTIAGAEPSPMKLRFLLAFLAFASASAPLAAIADSGDPDLIFRKSTTFKLLTPNDKLATYGLDDPVVDGVACYFTAPEKGGVSGALGLAEQTSDVSLACRQYGPIKIKEKFEQGDVVFRARRSILFKKMQIVRGCDSRRNVLIYMAYTDKLVEGSPKNSTSSVPIQPWGGTGDAPKCSDFLR
jgi:CreA protein